MLMLLITMVGPLELDTSLGPMNINPFTKAWRWKREKNKKSSPTQTQIEDGKDMTSFIYNITSFLLFSWYTHYHFTCTMASSTLSTHYHFTSPSSKNNANIKLSSSLFVSPISLSSNPNISLQFFDKKHSPLLSTAPRRLSVIAMAPPKPGGKAKKGKKEVPFMFLFCKVSVFGVFCDEFFFFFAGVAVIGLIKLALEAGKATPAPPVGPALGSKGVNILAFCKDYNARTADKAGYVIPVEITVYDVRISFFLQSYDGVEVFFFFFFWGGLWCFLFWPFVIIQDKSFTFVLKTPPASVLLLKAAGMLAYVFFSPTVWCFFFFIRWPCSVSALISYLSKLSCFPKARGHCFNGLL